MRLSKLLATLAVSGTALASPHKRDVDFDWGSTEVRGVNIGGWLVLEPWITPSLFQRFPDNLGIVDEYTMTERADRQQVSDLLREHWNTWTTFEDFQKIADSGFNVIRIPIGYWAFDTFDTPFISGQADYLDAAIDWARGTGLKIVIDLHGAPGSQNGFDNSGQRMDDPQWTQGDTVRQTLDVIQKIAEKYAQPKLQDVIIGIQLLNEPANWAVDMDVVRQFYRDGYGIVREVSDTPIIFSDAFLPPATFNGFLTPSDNNAQNVIVDHHEYQMFSNDFVAMEQYEHREFVCQNTENYSGVDKWMFVGEWTAAMTDCAFALNGLGRGARYDGTFPDSTFVGSCETISDLSTWPDWYRNDIRHYVEVQLDAFEKHTNGWFFWNFKTESAAEWDLFQLLDAGLFPQPLDDRKFERICDE